MKAEAALAPLEAMESVRGALRQRGVGAWEIYLSRERTWNVEVKEQEVESLSAALHSGMGLRVLESGRMGFAYSSDLSPGALAGMVDLARSSAAEVSPDPLYSFAGPDSEPAEPLRIYDGSRAERPESEKIERAKTLEAAALAVDPRLARVRKAEYHESEEEVLLWTSEGLDRRGRSTLCMGSLGAVAEANGDSQIAWELDFSHYYDKLDCAAIGRTAANQAVGLLGAKPVPSRRCPMVLRPEPAAELLGVLAEAVLKHRSWLLDRMGRPVAAPMVAIVDDGRCEAAPDAFPFDGEGERCRRTEVVAGGKLNSYLYDRYHGRRMGAAGTGNSQRESFTAPPTVGASCFYLEPGREPGAALVAGLGAGIVVEQLLGIHLADPVTGEFSVGIVGHLVEAGKLAAPVTGMALSGQIGELFAKVEAVGSDLRFFGEMGSPSLLVGDVAFSGR